MLVAPVIQHNRGSWLSCNSLFVAFCICSGVVFAEEPPFEAGKASQDTAAALEKYHATHRPLDDDLSAEWFAAFLERLDPRHMYFVASDLALFQPFEERLDDLAKGAGFQFAELVRAGYRQRTADAAETAWEMLGVEQDFTVAEEMPRRFEWFATDRDDLRERWRQRIKYELLLEKQHGRDLSEVKTQLLDRYERIARQARDMTDERLCQIYLDALVSRYDPDSRYLSESYLRSLEQTFALVRYTNGLGLSQRDGQFIIQSISPEIGNQRSAALIGWQLLAIHRDGGATFDVVEMHYEDLNPLITDPTGPLGQACNVTLELLHPLTLERQSVPWTRYRYSLN